jgi:hypothetical protein
MRRQSIFHGPDAEQQITVPLTQRSPDRPPSSWRTPIAIGLAVTAGVPVGVFLSACCSPPFGPVLLGWFVALVGAVVVSAGLCVLATDHETIVGVGYAAGVAASGVVARVITSGWRDALGSFAAVFMILAAVSLLGSVPVSVLKWEDRRARDKARADKGGQDRPT